ncbi:MAG: LrgB family protein [Gammaproteobacteria bacterium]|nr:LrgB family protein [Gammaproteobacteria bacterium]MDH5660553.1 LrgB family protein [Gammaproteobacteria bacterium]
MDNRVASLWVYLSATPLLHLTLTVCFFVLARWLYRKSGRRSWLNPVLLSVLALVAILIVTDTPYDVYFEGAQFVHFMLGPATVALAIPLYRQWDSLKRHPIALTVSLLTGSLTAVLSAIFIAKLGGVTDQALISIAPKSVTTPVAMGISETLGGLPSLTAVVVILTGILGASLGPWLLDKLNITNPMAKGLAMGTASHGIGTGRAIYMGDVAAAFSGLAMGLNGLATTILLPILWGWLAN